MKLWKKPRLAAALCAVVVLVCAAAPAVFLSVVDAASLGHGAVVRSCANYPGLDAAWYRTAVRTEQENRQLLALLAETLPEVTR